MKWLSIDTYVIVSSHGALFSLGMRACVRVCVENGMWYDEKK